MHQSGESRQGTEKEVQNYCMERGCCQGNGYRGDLVRGICDIYIVTNEIPPPYPRYSKGHMRITRHGAETSYKNTLK